jgi:hypothetical protein
VGWEKLFIFGTWKCATIGMIEMEFFFNIFEFSFAWL